MEDFISILMGASLLGLAKTDIKQQTEPVLPLSVEDRCMGKWASSRKLLLNGKKPSYPSIKERVYTNSSKNWRWLSKEQKVNE